MAHKNSFGTCAWSEALCLGLGSTAEAEATLTSTAAAEGGVAVSTASNSSRSRAYSLAPCSVVEWMAGSGGKADSFTLLLAAAAVEVGLRAEVVAAVAAETAVRLAAAICCLRRATAARASALWALAAASNSALF